jgi:RND family efflux transporter MFP subunit
MNTRSICLGFFACMLLSGGDLLGVQVPDERAPVAPPKVRVVEPVVRVVTDYETFIGNTEAMENVEVRARVTGHVVRIAFKPGTMVKQGELLFEIDARVYQAELNKAEAELKRSEARLKRATANLERARRLVAKGARARDEYDQIDAERTEAQAVVVAARAARDFVKLNLDFTRVTAPISGRISRPLLTVGNLARADESRLTTIVSVDPIGVYFDVDESTFLRLSRLIREGKIKARKMSELPAKMGLFLDKVELVGDKDFPHSGKVDFADNRVNAGTGGVRCRAVFPNTERIILPGMRAGVRLVTSTPYKALLVPEQAIGSLKGDKVVFVVTDKNVVQSRVVELGSRHGGYRVVVKGLKPGERIISHDLNRVRPGMTVQPEASPDTIVPPGRRP